MEFVFLPADITRFLKDYSTELSANYTTRLLFNGILITKNMIYMTTIIQDDVQNASHCGCIDNKQSIALLIEITQT